MLIVKLMGGLGNHMFIYAFARAYSLENKEPLVLYDCQKLEEKHGNDSSLESLHIPINEIELINKKEMCIRYIGVQQLLFRGLCWLLKNCPRKYPNGYPVFMRYLRPVINRLGIIIENNDYYILKRGKTKKCFAYGYFQTEKYFKKYSDLIKNELKVSESICEKNISIMQQIKNTESVCVHIRRGDYVGSKISDICTPDYYNEGINYIEKHIQAPTFFIFSDNQEWAKEIILCGGHKVVFVDQENRAHEDLQLMYSCKHFVISNSSFSWWAQYLGEYKDKIVIAPDRWVKDNSTREIYLENWIVLKT